MTIKEQVFAQAALLAGELEGKQQDLLNALCAAAVASLTARLKEGITPEDCKADFIAAASLYALAALGETAEDAVEEFKAGDLTVKQGGQRGAVSRCLERQAEGIMMPYVADRFSFAGV